jgi:chemotaxis protein MotB
MAGKGGGAWKVAYADFVTAMMAFFMVMWISAQNKPLKQAVARYFEDPFGTSKDPQSASLSGPVGAITIGPYETGRGPSRNATNPALKSDAENDQKPGGLAKPPRLLVFNPADRPRKGTNVPFPEDTAELDAAGRAYLDALVPLIMGKANKIEIRGHASRKPLPEGAPFKDNWQLSYARCQAVMAYLVEKGIAAERIRLSQAAEHEPYTLRRKRYWQAQNARVEVFPLSEYFAPFERAREERGEVQKPADAPAEEALQLEPRET